MFLSTLMTLMRLQSITFLLLTSITNLIDQIFSQALRFIILILNSLILSKNINTRDGLRVFQVNNHQQYALSNMHLV